MAGAGCIVLCQCVFLIFLCSLLGQVALFFVNVFSYVVFVLCSGSVHGWGRLHCLCQFVFLCFPCSLFWEPPWLGQVALFFVNVFSYIVFVLCSGSLNGWSRLHCSLPICFLIFSLFFVLGASMAGAGCIVLCQCVFLCFFFVLCSGSFHSWGRLHCSLPMCFLMFSLFFVLGASMAGSGCIILCQCVFLCFLCSLFWEPPWLGQVALFFVNVFSYVFSVLCSGSLHGWGRLHCSLPICFLMLSFFFVLGASLTGAGYSFS